MILIDTGPLVALFDRNDTYHTLCKKELARIRKTLVTTWPVLTEVLYLLNFSAQAQDVCFEFMDSGAVTVDATEMNQIGRIRDLMNQYKDLPMDFADASLVALAERLKISRIFTLDHKDFRIYKPRHARRFTLIPENV